MIIVFLTICLDWMWLNVFILFVFISEEEDCRYARMIQEELQRCAEEARRREKEDEVWFNIMCQSVFSHVERITLPVWRDRDRKSTKYTWKERKNVTFLVIEGSHTLISICLKYAFILWTRPLFNGWPTFLVSEVPALWCLWFWKCSHGDVFSVSGVTRGLSERRWTTCLGGHVSLDGLGDGVVEHWGSVFVVYESSVWSFYSVLWKMS